MKNKNLILVIMTSLILLSLISLKIFKKNSTNFKTVEIKKQDIVLSVKVNGKVEADKRSSLSFKIPGKINYLPLKKGDVVKKGQIVASIDPGNLTIEKEMAMKDYLTTRWNFEQMRQDYKINGTPLDQNILTDAQKRQLEKSQFELDKAVDRVEMASGSLSENSIYAPFNGVISDINGEIGSMGGPGISTIIIEQNSKLKISANVSEAEIVNIKKDNIVSVSFDALPNQVINGKVDQIDPSETIVSGAPFYQISITSDNFPENIRPGMSVTCIIKTQTKENVLSLPIYLINNYENDHGKVFILENKKQIEKQIELGIRGDGAIVEVLSGLKEGDQVVEPKN